MRVCLKCLPALMLAFSLLFVNSFAEFDTDQNAITLIDQQDRAVEIKEPKDPKVAKNKSSITGLKSSIPFQPVLVEIFNENGGVFATAPKGITEASIIYEYQTSTNGTMGMCALFQDNIPETVGPIGDASVGGLLIQDDWKCGYVYNDIPTGADGSLTELGYSIQNWIAGNDLFGKHMVFPASASMAKEWKQYFTEDKSMIISQNAFVDVSGIVSLLKDYKVASANIPFHFAKVDKELDGIPVREIDIRTPSRTYSSGFIYNDEDGRYYRWIGTNSQYGDVAADEQLNVSNLIIQRVQYSTSNKNMAPITIGRGNADIFVQGTYVEGYWVRESADDHTRFYDSDGNPVELTPGVTFISLLSNSTAVVILNY